MPSYYHPKPSSGHHLSSGKSKAVECYTFQSGCCLTPIEGTYLKQATTVAVKTTVVKHSAFLRAHHT